MWTPDFCQERDQETQGGQSKGEAFVCGVRMQRGEPKKGGGKVSIQTAVLIWNLQSVQHTVQRVSTVTNDTVLTV